MCKKGHVPWNKGLSKEDDKRIADYGRNVSKAKKGKPNLKMRGDNNPAKRIEVRQKISQSQKGKIPWNLGQKCPQISKGLMGKPKLSLRGKPTWNKGIKCPKISETKIRRGSHKLEKNSNWNGGSSFEPYGLEFNKALKNKIRKRDNYECQLCGLKENGKSHIPHHINYNKRDNREENLILLCNSHHSQTNYNRQYWINIFTGKDISSTTIVFT